MSIKEVMNEEVRALGRTLAHELSAVETDQVAGGRTCDTCGGNGGANTTDGASGFDDVDRLK